MDIFWVFILFFGIIVSIGQKASKKQAAADEDGESAPMSEQEMERRIREILEGKPIPQKPAPQPAVSTPTVSPIKKVSTPKKQHLAPTPTAAKTIKHPKEEDPIKQTEIKSGEIGQIVEDFTIEKAVIYSEIMNPKYKEY
ncbi:MAG: hypothetical protein II236_00295 [Alistipes sp.]|nr:hypothetical protein [Alistipes sp.]